MDASTKLRSRVRNIPPSTADMNESISQILERVFGIVRRQQRVFLIVIPCCIILAVLHLLTAQAIFTAHAQLLIDASKLKVLQQQETSDINRPIDSAQIETQVEIIKSRDIALSVIKSEHLENDPEFVGTGARLLARVLEFFGASDPIKKQSPNSPAVNSFLKKRNVTRIGQTYVLDVAFSSTDPARAATLANTLAEAYINNQLEAKFQAVRRASGWLEDRMKELRQQASDADQAVLAYKERNKIVDVGGSSSNGPRLIGEQQIEELNTQLSTARAAAAEANARLARIDDVLKQDIPDATVTDTLRSEVVTRLRNNYLDLASREAVWSGKYGANHLAVINLQTQMSEIRKAIRDELARIAQGYKSDAEIATSRVRGLERSLDLLISNSQAINRDKLGLKELESKAQAYHTIYDNFLQRYMEAIQQQSFPITESRIISSAEIPTRKSSPVTVVVLAISCVLGLIISAIAAVLLDSTNRALRTSEQVESFLNITCLAKLPAVPQVTSATGMQGGAVKGRATRTLAAPIRPIGSEASTSNSDIPELNAQRLISNAPMTRIVIKEPLSGFAEAFRSIKVAVDLDGFETRHKVVGISSALPGEGKSTVSSNFAQAIAHAGRKVILVDGDLRNPSLTRTLTPNAERGLLQVLQGSCRLDEALYRDAETGLTFVPAIVPPRHAHSNEVLASAAFAQMIDELSKIYEYVIVDFPPLAPVVDVRAGAHLVDTLLLVIEWGRTDKNLILQELNSAPELSEKIFGVILNKVDVKAQSRYEKGYARYYGEYYGRYGT